MPIKRMLDDDHSYSTGITYEFTAFDNRINNFLISSLRLSSINIPIAYNLPFLEKFYLNMGGGANLVFVSKQFAGINWVSTNANMRQFQPYISLGTSTLVDRGDSSYELGLNARYHVFNLWKNTLQTSTNIVGIDLNMKYYF
jgi:hypothetical protein